MKKMTKTQRKLFEVINNSDDGFHLALFEAEELLDALKRKNYVVRQPRSHYESINYSDKGEGFDAWFFVIKLFLITIAVIAVLAACFAFSL